MEHTSVQKTKILGVNVHVISLEQIIRFVCQSCVIHNKAIIVYANPHSMNVACRLRWFRYFLNDCDVVFCDGFGVKWSAKFLSNTLLHRYTPPDWIPLLAKEFARQGLSMYFLGGKPGVAQIAATRLTEQTPGLQVLGAYHGYFDKNPMSSEQQAVIAEINRLRPNLLVLGFGMPMQEKWIMENWANIDADVVLPAGALFDYLAGETYRAPRWMTDHGLEWLGRLIIEPRRLWKRYLIGNPLFVWRVLLQKMGLLRLK